MKTLSEERWYSPKQLIETAKILLFYGWFWIVVIAVALIVSLALGWDTENTYDTWPEP